MDNDLMIEYLIQMGMMAPEEAELKRKQAMIDSLRDKGATSPQGEMVGKHYVAPSITQYAAQMANAYGAGQGQKQLDSQLQGFSGRQIDAFEEMRRRRQRGYAGPDRGYFRDSGYYEGA
jgi:hypothetical protein